MSTVSSTRRTPTRSRLLVLAHLIFIAAFAVPALTLRLDGAWWKGERRAPKHHLAGLVETAEEDDRQIRNVSGRHLEEIWHLREHGDAGLDLGDDHVPQAEVGWSGVCFDGVDCCDEVVGLVRGIAHLIELARGRLAEWFEIVLVCDGIHGDGELRMGHVATSRVVVLAGVEIFQEGAEDRWVVLDDDGLLVGDRFLLQLVAVFQYAWVA